MSELSLVEQCLGNFVYILFSYYFLGVSFEGFIKKLSAKIALITMLINALSLKTLNVL